MHTELEVSFLKTRTYKTQNSILMWIGELIDSFAAHRLTILPQMNWLWSGPLLDIICRSSHSIPISGWPVNLIILVQSQLEKFKRYGLKWETLDANRAITSTCTYFYWYPPSVLKPRTFELFSSFTSRLNFQISRLFHNREKSENMWYDASGLRRWIPLSHSARPSQALTGSHGPFRGPPRMKTPPPSDRLRLSSFI